MTMAGELGNKFSSVPLCPLVSTHWICCLDNTAMEDISSHLEEIRVKNSLVKKYKNKNSNTKKEQTLSIGGDMEARS